MLENIKESANFLKPRIDDAPKIGIILGSGLGSFDQEIDIKTSIDYEEIPHFPISTVEGHSGKLLIGKVNGISIIALKGRFHYYEGYSLKKATFPVRVLKELGVEHLLLSNASGGLDPNHEIGDLMVLTDHIHLFPDNPLRGKNYDELGPRFPDMSEPYCAKMIAFVEELNKKEKLGLHQGVYLGTPGPTYETKAEYKHFSIIGADAVGMSTTAETIVAVHAGIKVFGISVISDLGVEGKIVEISHEEVQDVANKVAPKISKVFKALINHISNSHS